MKSSDAKKLFDDIEAGVVTLQSADGRTWDDVYAGNVHYRASNGWSIVVFNDCDSWVP